MSYSKIFLNSLEETKMSSKIALLANLLAAVGLSSNNTLFTKTKTAVVAQKKRRPKRHKRVYAKHTRGW